MKPLFDLSIQRKKLVITLLREIDLNDLVPVREVLNSIDFILGDDDKWEYVQRGNNWKAVIKIRLQDAQQILDFVEKNKDNLKLSSIDETIIADIVSVQRTSFIGKTKQSLQDKDKEEVLNNFKESLMIKFNDAINTINNIAKTERGI